MMNVYTYIIFVELLYLFLMSIVDSRHINGHQNTNNSRNTYKLSTSRKHLIRHTFKPLYHAQASDSLNESDDDDEETEIITSTTKRTYKKKQKNVLRNSIIESKDEKKFTTFTNQILIHTLKTLKVFKNQSNDQYWKNEINTLAKDYKKKLNDVIKITLQHRTGTRIGNKKSIFNLIDESDLILTRLANSMAHNIQDRTESSLKRLLDLEEIINKEMEYENKQACLELTSCRIRGGIVDVIEDLMSALSLLDDKQFKLSLGTLTNGIKKSNYSVALNVKNEKMFKRIIEAFEEEDINIKRAIVLMLRNIIKFRNKPLKVTSITTNIKTTLALRRIIDTLEENVPNHKNNVVEWRNQRIVLTRLNTANDEDISVFMTHFTKHINNILILLDKKSLKTIRTHVKELLP